MVCGWCGYGVVMVCGWCADGVRNLAAPAYAIGEYGCWMRVVLDECGLDEPGLDEGGLLLWPGQLCPVATPPQYTPSFVGLPTLFVCTHFWLSVTGNE